MQYSIAICLATYNGEKYLAEQLNSLLNQDYKNIKVYIHDDGSVDGTIGLIRDYADKYPDIFIFFDDDICYRNCGLNFIETLKRIPKHDFYMFCDQDDVWLGDKVSKTLNEVLKNTTDVKSFPILAYTDLVLVDEELNVLKDGLYNYLGYKKNVINYESSVGWCISVGCTMLFNHVSKELIDSYNYPSFDKKMYHDYWTGLVILSNRNAETFYLDQSTMFYRQHGLNAVGYKFKKKSNRFAFLRTFIYIFDIFSTIKLYKKINFMNTYIPRKVSFIGVYLEKVKTRYRRIKK